MRTRAFTLLETLIGGALFGMILGALLYLSTGSRKLEEAARLQVSLTQNISQALHTLHTDLRQLSIVPDHPIEGFSFRTSSDYHAILLRRSVPDEGTTAPTGSAFTFVMYHLVPSGQGDDRFHLARIEWMASSRNFPGETVSRKEKIFRSFSLRWNGTTFLHRQDVGTPPREVLHVALDVVSDSMEARADGPFGDKSLVVTMVVRLIQPEAPYLWPDPFAVEALMAPLPPGDVLAPRASHAQDPLVDPLEVIEDLRDENNSGDGDGDGQE